MIGAHVKWFREAGWGVMFHYLAGRPSIPNDANGVSAADWNARVDAFNLDRFVSQVVSTGARYALFSIGQDSGHFCSPNATYDELTGIRPSKCSRRDLILDIAHALEPHGVRLLAYVSCLPPHDEPAAIQALKCTNTIENRHIPEKLSRCVEFQLMWNRILAEWSVRWGRHVHGWWVDGFIYGRRCTTSRMSPTGRACDGRSQREIRMRSLPSAPE